MKLIAKGLRINNGVGEVVVKMSSDEWKMLADASGKKTNVDVGETLWASDVRETVRVIGELTAQKRVLQNAITAATRAFEKVNALTLTDD